MNSRISGLAKATVAVLAASAGLFAVCPGEPALATVAPTPMLGTLPHGTSLAIYLNDHTSSEWPVHDAAKVWNDYLSVNHIKVSFRFTDDCSTVPGPYPCIDVREDNVKYMWPVLGEAYVYNQHTGIRPTTSNPAWCALGVNGVVMHNFNVIKDDTYKTAREDTVLHELGHVLGLEHDPTPGDLMYYNRETSEGFTNSQKNTPSVANMLPLTRYNTPC